MKRSRAVFVYLVLVGLVLGYVDFVSGGLARQHEDRLFKVVFLCVAAALLNVPQVRIDQGRLSLSGIAIGVAALQLNPIDATLVGLASSASLYRRSALPILGNAVLSSSVGAIGSALGLVLEPAGIETMASRSAVLVVCAFLNVVTVGFAFRFWTGLSIQEVLRTSTSASILVALSYIALAALLASYVLDGSLTGYFLGTIVCVLALALTDTISGRRVRRVLESELSDADRHLFHSRAVEGVVHNLRNHMATAVGYLKEIDPRRLDPVDREAIETATAAANDAVTVLRSLAQGATPRVNFAAGPIDLNELVARAAGMARPRARTKEVQVGVRESSEDVRVRADPLLMREVITNLVNNAIDAVSTNGSVLLSTGRRSNGTPFFSVADDGPGVSDEERHHLFEPHFTTKEGGTGLGLFMSYGIVREHQGDIVFSNNRPHGAVFTVVLPAFPG